jgi:hypothetical protein
MAGAGSGWQFCGAGVTGLSWRSAHVFFGPPPELPASEAMDTSVEDVRLDLVVDRILTGPVLVDRKVRGIDVVLLRRRPDCPVAVAVVIEVAGKEAAERRAAFAPGDRAGVTVEAVLPSPVGFAVPAATVVVIVVPVGAAVTAGTLVVDRALTGRVVVVGEGSTVGGGAGTGGATVVGTAAGGSVAGGTVGTDLGGGTVVTGDTGAGAGWLRWPRALAPSVRTPAQIGRASTTAPTTKRVP